MHVKLRNTMPGKGQNGSGNVLFIPQPWEQRQKGRKQAGSLDQVGEAGSSQEKPRRKAGHPAAKMEALSGREGEREAVTGTRHTKPQLV